MHPTRVRSAIREAEAGADAWGLDHQHATHVGVLEHHGDAVVPNASASTPTAGMVLPDRRYVGGIRVGTAQTRLLCLSRRLAGRGAS
jgi:hypothetical protein